MSEVKIELGAVVDLASGAQVDKLDHKVSSLFGQANRKPLYKPVVNTGTVPSAGGQPLTINVGGPASGKVWDLRQLVVVGSDDRFGPAIASNTFAAAASGSILLPAGASLSEVIISAFPATSAVGATFSINNTDVGNFQIDIGFSTGGSSLSFSFPVALPALSAGSSIQVSMPAVVGGPAYSMMALGTYPVAWYRSFSDSLGLPNILVPGAQSTLPSSYVPAGTKSIFLHFGEELSAVVYGLTTGQQATAIAQVAEWDEGTMERSML